MPLIPPARTPPRGFTLVELMVVAAIIAVLLITVLPAVRGLLQSSSQAQAENAVRGILTTARVYAMKHRVVAGVRFQGDGHAVVIYARNHEQMDTPDSLSITPVYDMKAVEGVAPARIPDPWRVTAWDVGECRWTGSSGWMGAAGVWSGTSDNGYPAAPEWLSREEEWFVYPVVLFSPLGKPLLAECKFSNSWYPTMDGAFGNATDQESNPWPQPAHPQLKFTVQPAVVGWKSRTYYYGLGYKGGGSHRVPVEAPTVTRAPRLFNYEQFRLYDPAEIQTNATVRNDAMRVILDTAVDLRIDQNTGMTIRMEPFRESEGNL